MRKVSYDSDLEKAAERFAQRCWETTTEENRTNEVGFNYIA